MLGNNANIKAVITAEDNASRVLHGFGRNIGGIGHTLGNLGKIAAVGLAAAAGGAIAFGISSVKSFQESQDSLAQLNAVIQSTGGVAGVTADMATELADSLQKVTKYSDEEIVSAENLLLTFTKINKDIFPEATKIVLDMSTALGQDLKSSSIQVGKALQDPILGVTALRRVGVNFSEDQQEVIRNLVETGRSAEAQRLILKELNTEFGGSASAAAGTFAGKLAILRNQFDEVKEKIGEAIVTAIDPWVQKLADFVASEQFQTWLQETTDWLAANIPIWIEAINNFIHNTDWQAIITSIGDVINALRTIGDFLGRLKDINDAVMGRIVSMLGWVVYNVQLGIEMWKMTWNNLVNSIRFGVDQIMGFVRRIPGAVLGAMAGIAGMLAAPFQSAFRAIVSAWNSTIGGKGMTFPSWVPGGLGGKSFTIPRFAGGTAFAPGGLATVGEMGREQVILPRGSRVIPNNSIKEKEAVTINLTVQAGAFMGTQQDARKYASMIMDALKDVATMNGTSVARMMQ